MELIKTQMQVGGETSISGTIRNIVNSAGLRGLCRGLGITFTREAPAFGIYFGSYEVMIRQMGDSDLAVLSAGGMAGVFSWIFTYPQDVIKSRLQADGFGSKQQYFGVKHCLKESLARDGSSFLSRGIISTIIRAFPMNAATFYVYVGVMKAFADKEEAIEDTFDTLKTLGLRPLKYTAMYSEKVPDSWSRRKAERLAGSSNRLALITTDMPNIITVKEQSNLAQWRLFPEQMLYACPSVQKETRHHDTTFFFRQNFNEFNQYMLEEVEIPIVIPSHLEQEDRPSLLTSETQEKKWRNSIRTADFLLPTNLLAHHRLDRIYGFYYIMA